MDQDHGDAAAFERYNELQLLEALEANPETTQADLAVKAGVAVGTVNWYLKRWTAKGLVKVKKIGRWRWRYLLTPQGLAEKADLANRYFQASMQVYRRTRADAKEMLGEVKAAGYDSVVIEGEGDIAEIFELTCLEVGITKEVEPKKREGLPRIVIYGQQLETYWPEPDGDSN